MMKIYHIDFIIEFKPKNGPIFFRDGRVSVSKDMIFISGAGSRPKAPVTEGGNRRDWFPGVRGPRAASSADWNHTIRDAYENRRQVYERTYF
jgi:hypothetical protein